MKLPDPAKGSMIIMTCCLARFMATAQRLEVPVNLAGHCGCGAQEKWVLAHFP
jgi:hypothetical protein